MRKFLLASIALLGATSVAQAQKAVHDTGDSKMAGNSAGGGSVVAATPGPGQMAVRLNGIVRFYYQASSGGALGNSTGKVSTAFPSTYIRLYPGFEAQGNNGLLYGASAEIRTDQGHASLATPGSQSTPSNSLYTRRAYGYVGHASVGTLRLGMGDSPFSLMATGQMFGLGDSNFCGDTWSVAGPARMGAMPSPFQNCSGNMYTTNKIVYLTPSFNGFDFGVGFEPNTGTGGMQSGCLVAGSLSGCDNQSSGAGNDLKRRRNTVDVAARYRGVVNGVGVAVSGGYLASGKVANVTGAATGYENLSVGWGGVTVSYAGFTFEGAIEGGKEDKMALLVTGAPNQLTWQVGTSYTTGPVQIGVSYVEASRAGTWNGTTITGKRKDSGIYSAVNYGIAPGIAAMLILATGESTQAGADINAYKSGTQSTAEGQMVTAGVLFRW